MLYNKQLLPLVTIKKVSVFKNNKFSYGVDFSLSRFSQETSEDFKNQIKNITDKLKIVFVVLHSETERYLAGFQSDALRHKALMEFKRDHSSFVKEISFTDFIQKSDSNTLNTAGSTTHQIQEFTGTEIIETEALSPRVENNINNVHLLSFLITQETERPPSKYVYTKGSNLEYELVLTRTTENLLVPATLRKAFFIKSTIDPKIQKPYVGPAHYHDQSNPGPNGYIGWMAGHPKQQMGPPLEVREVSNYKITIEDDFFSYKAKIEKPEIPKTFSQATQGSGLIKHIKKEMNFSRVITKQEIKKQISIAAKSSLEKEGKSFFLGFGNKTLHLASISQESNVPMSNSDIKHNNYHGSVFGIDILSMIKYRSEFGPLIAHHYNKSNMDIIQQMLNYSHIHKLQIKRKRISNYANSKSSKGTFQRSEFNKEEKKIVCSRDNKSSSSKSALKKYRSLNGEVYEIQLAAISPTGQVFDHPDCRYIRHFMFKDFDLFHNIEDGFYTYEVTLELIDGMKAMLKSKYNNLKKINLLFQKFVQRANLMQRSRRRGRRRPRGSEEMRSFIQDPDNISIANRAVLVYFETLRLIDGDRATKERKKALQNSVSPKNIDINTINKFANSLDVIESSFAEMLKIRDHNQVGKKSSSNLTGTFPGMITETFKTGIRAEAFPSSKLIADFSLANSKAPVVTMTNLMQTLQKVKSNKYNNSYIPRDLKTIQGQKYKTIDTFSSKPNNEKTLTQFSAKVIASSRQLGPNSSIEGSNKKFQVAVLEQPDAAKKSLLNKGDLFYSHAVQQIGKGVKLKINGIDLASSSKKNTDSGEKITAPVLSSAVQKSIFDVSKKTEDKDLTLKEVEKEYKNMHNIRSKLGSIYEGFSTAFKVGEKNINSSSQKKIYEDKYKGKSFNLTPSATGQQSMIDEYSAKLSVHLPGIYEQEISISKLRTIENNRVQKGVRKYLLMKMEAVFSKNTLLSNNVFFVEV